MRLSLSSAAAPDAALAELLAACARRGLAALELVEGHAHGVTAELDAARADAVHGAASDAGVAVCGLYREMLGAPELEPAARLAATLRAPVVVQADGVDPELLPAAAAAFTAAGAELLLAHGSDPDVVELINDSLAGLPESRPVGLAWEVRPESDDPALIGRVLAAAGPRLRHVRLHGGGPESAQQTGRGVGALMARLALARYTGPLVLTPSDPRFHYVWRAWLGRAGGWGCGSKQSDPSIVMLEQETITTGGGS